MICSGYARCRADLLYVREVANLLQHRGDIRDTKHVTHKYMICGRPIVRKQTDLGNQHKSFKRAERGCLQSVSDLLWRSGIKCATDHERGIGFCA